MPAWSASITQVPAWLNVTVPLLIEHALLVVDGSMLNTTGLFDAPPVAVGV